MSQSRRVRSQSRHERSQSCREMSQSCREMSELRRQRSQLRRESRSRVVSGRSCVAVVCAVRLASCGRSCVVTVRVVLCGRSRVVTGQSSVRAIGVASVRPSHVVSGGSCGVAVAVAGWAVGSARERSQSCHECLESCYHRSHCVVSDRTRVVW